MNVKGRRGRVLCTQKELPSFTPRSPAAAVRRSARPPRRDQATADARPVREPRTWSPWRRPSWRCTTAPWAVAQRPSQVWRRYPQSLGVTPGLRDAGQVRSPPASALLSRRHAFLAGLPRNLSEMMRVRGFAQSLALSDPRGCLHGPLCRTAFLSLPCGPRVSGP